MHALPDSARPWRQRLKWAVYALLFLDFLVYLQQDIASAPYVLDAQSGVREVLAAYVTSIDLIAWFVLILLYELETATPAARDWTGARRLGVRGVRLACTVAILHTSFVNDVALREFLAPAPLPPAQDVCAYAGEWSFLRNRDFLTIDAGNCRTIGQGPDFFALSDDAVLTDRAGLREGTILAWTDLAESIAWLLVILATEAVVRIGPAPEGRARAALSRASVQFKRLLYGLIVAIAIYWGTKDQLLYLWDELVWLLGFLVIDANVRDWRTLRRTLSASPSPA